MSCITCDNYLLNTRITNISNDTELKEKFENLIGHEIYQNIHLCDTCESLLIQSYNFKEKCIEALRGFIEPSINIELIKEEINIKDENNYSDDDDDNYIDPLIKEQITVKKSRCKYTLKEKLRAIELAERSSNRKAGKILKIDETCIGKWRNKKAEMLSHANKNVCIIRKSRKKKKIDEIKQIEVPEVSSFSDEILQQLSQPEVKPKQVKTRKSYSSGLKLEVVAFAEVAGNRQASKTFNIDETCIGKWRNQKEMLIEVNRERGTKRKPNLRFPELESRLKLFAFQKLDEGIVLKPGEIREEAFRLASELNVTNFKGTTSYIFNFMERYHIPSKGRLKKKKKIE